MNRTDKTCFIITGALIAAAYAGLTYLSNIFGLAYGPIQLRLSEALTVLPVFTPAAVLGLTVGCFLGNIGSFNVLDMVFGTTATLTAALLTYLLRKYLFKGLPILSLLPPIIVNSAVIGAEISLFYLPQNAGYWGFVISALEVGVSEAVVCFVFGIPLYLVIKKYKIFEKRS